MSQKRTRIRSLTLVNFRGVFFKTLEMHPLMSNLIGHNGAGKTTIMGALLINRVPDNRLVRLRNNSDSGQDRSDNGVWGRISPGICYSLVDYEAFTGERIIAGVQLKQLSKPRVELKLFAITGIDPEVPVRDLVMKPVAEKAGHYEPLEGRALKNQVTLMGGELRRFDTTAQYMDWQFNQRIIPRRMENSQDRQRYYRMLETSLYGGLSSELQKGLRDYLLPADHRVRQSIGSMQNALQETRRTRNQIEDTRKDRKLVKEVLESSFTLGEHVLAWSEKRQSTLQAQLKEKRQEEQHARSHLETRRQQLAAIETRFQTLETRAAELEWREEDASQRLENARDLGRLHTEQDRLRDEQCNHHQQLEELSEQKQLLDAQHQQQADELQRLEEDIASLVEQLTSVEQAYSEEARKAGLYQAAQRALEAVRDSFQQPELPADGLDALLASHQQLQDSTSRQYYQQKPRLEQAENIRSHFDATLKVLNQLGDQQVSLEQAAERTDFWLSHGRDQETLAATHPLLQQQKQQRQQEEQQLAKVRQALETLPEHWRNSITDEASWNTSLYRAETAHSQCQQTIESNRQQQSQAEKERDQTRRDLEQARKDHQHWSETRQVCQEITRLRADIQLTSGEDFTRLRQQLGQEQKQNLQDEVRLNEQLDSLRRRMRQLEVKASAELQQLQKLAELTGGVVISDYFDSDDISLDEAAWLEAKVGPLRHALQVRDINRAAAIIREESERPDHVWLLAGEPGQSFSEDDYLHAPLDQQEDGNVLVTMLPEDSTLENSALKNSALKNSAPKIARLSREPEFPTIGRLAREKEQARLREQEEALLDQSQELAVARSLLDKLQPLMDQLSAHRQWLEQPKPPVQALAEQQEVLQLQLEALKETLADAREQLGELSGVLRCLQQWQASAWLLNVDPDRESLAVITEKLEQATWARNWLEQHTTDIQQLNDHRLFIQQPPVDNLDELRQELEALEQRLSLLSEQKDLLRDAITKTPNLRFAQSVTRQEEKGNLQSQLRQEHETKKTLKHNQGIQVSQLREQCSQLERNITAVATRKEENEKRLSECQRQISDIPLEWKAGLEEECQHQLTALKVEKTDLVREEKAQNKEATEAEADRQKIEEKLSDTIADILTLEPKALSATDSHQAIQEQARSSGLGERLHTHHLLNSDGETLRNGLAEARASLEKALESESGSELLQNVQQGTLSDLPGLFQCFVASQHYLSQRMDKTLYQSDDPRQSLEQLEAHLTRLETILKDAEKQFLAESDNLGRNIQRRINMERKQIHQLNSALSSVFFGTIRAIKIELNVIDSYQRVLDALQQQFYADLFQQPDMTVEAALESLFKKETGGVIAGEKLLDYREYIQLSILIQRAGHHTFEPANPTNLSTGEAIGTGLAILTMVLHSWEVATEKRHGQGHAASRLLFLDEAARLDARALATLEELCGHQSLQLLVGAPDNVLPKNGITYRMVRLMEPYEHVIFSGVKGRLPQESQS